MDICAECCPRQVIQDGIEWDETGTSTFEIEPHLYSMGNSDPEVIENGFDPAIVSNE